MNHPPSSCSSSRIFLALLLVNTVLTSRIVLSSSSRYHANNNADHSADGGDHELLMMERFHAWMAAHGRSYPTAEEKLRRFRIFRNNVEFIEAINRDTSRTFSCGENQFTDLTHQEFLARYTMASPDSVPLDLSSSVITTRAGDITQSDSGTRMQVEEAALPEHVDWRQHNAVTPVQDQFHGCEACWVFASVATIESAYKIKEGELLKLSEQQIVDCSDKKCDGGYLQDAFKYVKKAGGIALDWEYGVYTAKAGCCHADEVHKVVRIQTYVSLPIKNETALAEMVAQQPVAVLFDAHDPAFACYKGGGIYSAGRPGAGYYDHNHALAIVGYGKNQTTGQKYWIAKNSWGIFWGDDGYVYIERDMPDNPQGVGGLVAKYPWYPVV